MAYFLLSICEVKKELLANCLFEATVENVMEEATTIAEVMEKAMTITPTSPTPNE